ncbi:MAG TPA: succinate dehydrogenase assembly factor 2 [Afipia sp.]
MSGSSRSSDGLDPRRKRLLFRCWHRGTREMDMLLGGFADLHIATIDDAELGELERLIELPDPDLYAAFCEKEPLPPEFADGIFLRIKAFGTSGQPV